MAVTSSSVSKWLSFATNLAVVGGLVLVAYELNQNSDLARAELINDGNAFENEHWQVLMGEAPTELIAKSVECPEKMSYAEFIAMDAYLYTSINIVYRNYELAKEGLFTQSDWQSEADDYVHWYLGDTFSRTWWSGGGKSYFDSEFSNYVDSLLEKKGIDTFGTWQRLRSNLGYESTSKPPISKLCL
jgi:hypothetical protein